jgi:hypothetical protein
MKKLEKKNKIKNKNKKKTLGIEERF